MRIKMLADDNFKPPLLPMLRIKYLKHREYTVKRSWGTDMVTRMKAIEIPAPARNFTSDSAS